jgi:predicted DNA-binding antitoxin AbrB/MazE fold protein
MTKTLVAVFDGQVFRPEEPLELEPNTRVQITIETSGVAERRTKSFLRTARSLHLKGPSDWSTRVEDYLYGRQTDSPEGTLS